MTTIAIDLPEDTVQRISNAAARLGMSLEEYARDALSWSPEEDEGLLPPVELTPLEVEGIRRGLTDAEAGRTLTHEALLVEMAAWRDQ